MTVLCYHVSTIDVMAFSPYFINPGLLSDDVLHEATDDDLSSTVLAIHAEQARRALESGDPAAIAEEAFEGDGFGTSPSSVKLPYIYQGFLVCPGLKFFKSQTAHDCTFISIGEVWSWEHPEQVYDEMRQLPGQKKVLRSVSIIPALEGMEFDVVSSTSKSGARCQMKSVRSFEIKGGDLRETKARTRSTSTSHR